jgi:hypothetical protein
METDDLLCSRNARPQKDGKAGEDVANSGGLIPAILETTYTSKLGRIIYVLNHGPADVRSSVDWLDPIHGGSVMLIRTRCCDKPRGREYTIECAGLTGLRQNIQRCNIPTVNPNSESYADQWNYR